MKIILSPAKKMKVDQDTFPVLGKPLFIQESQRLLSWMKQLNLQQQKELWGCSDRLVLENRQRLQDADLETRLTPALLAYDGIQYTTVAPTVFDAQSLDYLQDHLRILSGLYGVLRPFDGVIPYRLEMQSKIALDGITSLYDFWGDRLYQAVLDEGSPVVNLASQEYARCVEKFIQPKDQFITCIFGELKGQKVLQKSVYSKMARGQMVRFLAENRCEEPQQMKGFDWDGYQYDPHRSSPDQYVFIQNKSSVLK